MKKILFITILLLCLYASNNLIHSIYNLWQKQSLVFRAQQQLEREKKEHEKLKAQAAVVEKPTFIEKEARNKLFLVKPDEKPVFIPKELVVTSGSAQKKIVTQEGSHWQQWFSLFF